RHGPWPRAMTSGWPPTAPKARAGLLTPPGITRQARSNASRLRTRTGFALLGMRSPWFSRFAGWATLRLVTSYCHRLSFPSGQLGFREGNPRLAFDIVFVGFEIGATLAAPGFEFLPEVFRPLLLVGPLGGQRLQRQVFAAIERPRPRLFGLLCLLNFRERFLVHVETGLKIARLRRLLGIWIALEQDSQIFTGVLPTFIAVRVSVFLGVFQ